MITPKIRMLCFVLINSVLLNLLVFGSFSVGIFFLFSLFWVVGAWVLMVLLWSVF